MKLAFSTLGCPQWTWDRIVEQARVLGYDGIEVRGLLDEMDLEKLPPFALQEQTATLARLHQLQLSLCCLDTSCAFLAGDFDETLRAGRAAVDLATALGTPWIRVFGDRFPAGMEPAAAVAQVARGMNELGRHAEGQGVSVLLETHGDFAKSALLKDVFARVDSPATGVLWDLANPFEVGDTLEQVWERLGPLIAHVHVKDMTERGKLCLPGKGAVPIGRAVKLLRDGGYDGWLSFEWEKRWHTGLETPEVALPAYVDYMAQYL